MIAGSGVKRSLLPPHADGTPLQYEEDLHALPGDFQLLHAFFGRCMVPFSVYDSELDANACLAKLHTFFRWFLPMHIVYFLGHGRESDGAWKLANATYLTFADIITAWNRAAFGKRLFMISDSCYSGKLRVEAARLKCQSVFLQASCDISEEAVDGSFTPRWIKLQNGGTSVKDFLEALAPGFRHLRHPAYVRRLLRFSQHPKYYAPRTTQQLAVNMWVHRHSCAEEHCRQVLPQHTQLVGYPLQLLRDVTHEETIDSLLPSLVQQAWQCVHIMSRQAFLVLLLAMVLVVLPSCLSCKSADLMTVSQMDQMPWALGLANIQTAASYSNGPRGSRKIIRDGILYPLPGKSSRTGNGQRCRTADCGHSETCMDESCRTAQYGCCIASSSTNVNVLRMVRRTLGAATLKPGRLGSGICRTQDFKRSVWTFVLYWLENRKLLQKLIMQSRFFGAGGSRSRELASRGFIKAKLAREVESFSPGFAAGYCWWV